MYEPDPLTVDAGTTVTFVNEDDILHTVTSGRRAKPTEDFDEDLDGYREDFGAFLESANPNLTKEAVAEALDPHVKSLLTTIDSAVAGDTKVFDDLRTAASHDVDLANTLAGAIAAQFPEMFGSA